MNESLTMRGVMQVLVDHYGEERMRRAVPYIGIALALMILGACLMVAALATILTKAAGG